jgi:hypothetical protein
MVPPGIAYKDRRCVRLLASVQADELETPGRAPVEDDHPIALLSAPGASSILEAAPCVHFERI